MKIIFSGSITGEAFRTEEMEEMLAAAVDPDTQNINYKEFVSKLIVEDI